MLTRYDQTVSLKAETLVFLDKISGYHHSRHTTNKSRYDGNSHGIFVDKTISQSFFSG